jgi:catechol 2,3-dioxygenase-like lactoylglutathione lyase family enzyme
MAIQLNHTIVPAHDKDRAAGFLARILGLGPAALVGPFAAVEVNSSLTFDYADTERFEPHHYAFEVSDEEFDAIFARVQREGVRFSADPLEKEVGSINRRGGGRGFYFRDPDGHVLEVLTHPQPP